MPSPSRSTCRPCAARRRGGAARGRERGQASLEWLAVVTLVATLLGGLGAGLAQAEFLGRRVTRAMARAICLVGDGDCRRDQEPCVVASRSAAGALAVEIAIVRLGEDRLGLIERRSDGTFAVTIEDGMTAGVAAAVGLSAGIEVGGVGITVGGEVAAALLARHGRGRTWIVGSAAEAQRVLAAEGDDRAPDAESGSGAWSGSLGATAGATLDGTDAGVDLAAAGLTSDRAAGWRVDRRTGHRTAYVQASWSGSATAGGGGVLGVGGGGGGEVYAVEFDAGGRPVDLRVVASGAFGGSRDLPAVVQPVAGLLAAAGEGRTYEVTAHLDLTDQDDLAAARELLEAITGRRAGAVPAEALRRRLAARGTVEARVLATRSGGTGAGFHLTVEGLKVGARARVQERSQRLLAATSRGLDGQWITRTDCIA